VTSACTYGLPSVNPLSIGVASALADCPAEDVDRAFTQCYDRALGVFATALAESSALRLALTNQSVYRGDFHFENLFDSTLDLSFICPWIDDESVFTFIEQVVTLLRDHRRNDDVAGVLVNGGHLTSSNSSSLAVALAERPVAGPVRNCSSAPDVNTTSSEIKTSYVLSWSGATRCTFCRLRRLFHATASSRCNTTRTFLRSVTFFNAATAARDRKSTRLNSSHVSISY